MTLPLIYLLSQCGAGERRKIINTVKNHSDNTERVLWLMDKVNESGGIEYATEKMVWHKQQALNLLETLPNNKHREALKQLIDYVIERKK